MLTIKEKLAKNYINARGWKTKHKYLIIESDDWGTVRMPSITVYNKLIENNIRVDNFTFDKYDSLESKEDLEALYKTLTSLEDSKGNPAVLTAYHVMANPNFEAIEKNGRTRYEYETILETYKRKPHTQDSFATIQKGIKMGVYIPQFHGREHIHVKRWMEAINSESEKEQIAFTLNAIISTNSNKITNQYNKNYFAGHDYDDSNEFDDLECINAEGLDMFEDIFGYKSLSFVAQGSFWGDHILRTLEGKGVILIGGRQFHPFPGTIHKFTNKIWGENNKLGQIHWRRNVLFEPSSKQDFDWVRKSLAEIEIAFRWGKPAVISSHRYNFIGSIFDENRTKSLQKLEELLKKAIMKWPKIEFISTHELAKILSNSTK
jgi:hypothetical protein